MMVVIKYHLSILATLLVTMGVTDAYPYFESRLPNGNGVPHPCKPNFIWYGVGHENSKGGGVRNAFGEAFERWGFEWNICLCQEDSDGDGKTNGEELGDPNCVWRVGEAPERTHDLSHPGICDPFYGAECADKNKWVDCNQASEFKCDAIDAPDVKTVPLNLKRTAVPAKETTYICQTFNISQLLPEGESHMIASTPRIENINILHHIVVFACDEDNAQKSMDLYENPAECGMETQLCRTIVTVWTVGVDGICMNENFGFAMGKNGFTTFMLQFHWNNHQLKSDYTDASGMDFYVKTNKRPNDGAMMFIGSIGLIIPPGLPSFTEKGECTSECTSLMLDKPIYITQIIPHMHYLGTGFVFQQYRNGRLIFEKVVERYLYDSPDVFKFTPPIQVMPGDELKVECVFQSVNKKNMTFYGESTSAEMCYAMTMYYPRSNSITECLGNDGFSICQGNLHPVSLDNLCDQNTLYGLLSQDKDYYTHCDVTGAECWPDCNRALEKYRNLDCLKGNIGRVFEKILSRRNMFLPLLSALHSCDPRPEQPPLGSNDDGKPSKCDIKPPVSAATKWLPTYNVILQMICLYVGINIMLIKP